MSDSDVYDVMVAQLEPSLGPKDPLTLTAIVGFVAGGPVSVFRFQGPTGRTFATCELIAGKGQKHSTFGRYELLVHCEDEVWAQNFLTAVAVQTHHFVLGPGHTLDLSAVLEDSRNIAGAFLEPFLSFRRGLRKYSVVRCVGVTSDELEFAVDKGVPALIEHLRQRSVYPVTEPDRSSSLPGTVA